MGGPGGSYLYLVPPLKAPIGPQFTGIATIESMVTPLQSPKCLSFWTQMRGTDTMLEVTVVRYGEAVPQTNSTYPLSAPNSIVGPKNVWTKISLTIDPKLIPNAKVFSVRIRGFITDFHNFIALDDVMLSDRVCSSDVPTLLICDGVMKQYSVAQRCNFVKDCPLGDDELGCGDCDFEQGKKF